MPLIDTKTAQPGTIGYLPPGTCFEFDSVDDLNEFADPKTAFVLGEDRKWRHVHDMSECVFDPRAVVNMFDDWREAVRYRVNRDIADALDEMKDAMDSISRARMVGVLLEGM